MVLSSKLDVRELMLGSLRGTGLKSLEAPAEGVWHFSFGCAGLTVECPWRVVAKGVVVLGARDDGQKFGLPEPVSVLQEFPKLVHNVVVTGVTVDDETADLSIIFGDDLRLDAFNESSGYEGWNYGDTKAVMIVATGGGELAIWTKAQPPRGEAT
jgi:hypothetical protein